MIFRMPHKHSQSDFLVAFTGNELKGLTQRGRQRERKDLQIHEASFHIQVKSFVDQSSEDLRWFTVTTSST